MINLIHNFRVSSAKKIRRSVALIAFNLVSSALLIVLFYWLSEKLTQIDVIDIFFEAGSCLTHFVLYSVIAFIHLKKNIKWPLMLGLLLTQTGLMLDFMDEFVVVDSIYWHRVGDFLYFVGAVFAAVGISSWISYSYQTATLDALTGLYGRRFFESFLHKYLQQLQRQPYSSCFISLDLDNFKLINDNFGHSTGDTVIKLTATVLTKCTRSGDLVCRSGGEEFEILLVRARVEDASNVAKRILRELKQSTPEGIPALTASIGVAEISQEDSVDSIRIRSDAAMYQAKHGGKNQIVVV